MAGYCYARHGSEILRDPTCDVEMATRFANLFGDQNGDGAITMTDVWIITKSLFFLPGDGVIYAAYHENSAGMFFEITPDFYGGVFSGIVSLLIWLVLLSVVGSVFDR